MQVREIARVMGGAAALDGPVTSPAELRQEIGHGLRVAVLEQVCAQVHDDPAARRALMHRVVPEGSLKRRVREGRLSPAESERTARLANVIAQAEHVWRDAVDARRFLTTPHPELGDRPPIEAALDEFGARHVEEILDGILHGLPA
jgi:putative toxin-antitoxin system antitoxin component (TIGR02293 family)